MFSTIYVEPSSVLHSTVTDNHSFNMPWGLCQLGRRGHHVLDGDGTAELLHLDPACTLRVALRDHDVLEPSHATRFHGIP